MAGVLLDTYTFICDPFDRLLAAQAVAEGLELLSADAKLDANGVRRTW